MCEYFLVIPIDVPSFKLIEGQIKELKGVVPNTPPPPRPENDQKSPGRTGLRVRALNTQLLFQILENVSQDFYGSTVDTCKNCAKCGKGFKTGTN